MLTGVFAPLAVRDYRRLWIGQVVSVVGDKINQIAMAMLVYALTRSMMQMGIMLAVTFLPAAILGLPAGVFVDRWDRRLTMIGADLVRAVTVLVIPLVVRWGIEWAYVLAFVSSTVALFFIPAKRTLIPELVDDELLLSANSLDSASESVAELVGLAFGGALVALLGFGGAFVADSATFVFSAIMVFAIGHREQVRDHPAAHAGVFREVAEGMRYLWRSDILRELSAIYVMVGLLASAGIAICYALALKRYDAGAWGVALLDAAITVGALGGALAVARSGPSRSGLKVLGGIATFGLAFGLIALADSMWLAVILLVVGGVANMWFTVPVTTIFQTRSTDQIRGRVMAALTTWTRVSMVLGVLVAGAVADRISLAWMTGAVGFLALLVAAAGFSRAAIREA